MEVASILEKPENKRAIRGYAIIAKGDEPKQLKENVFRVPSQNSKKYYYVTNKNEIWHCTCPDHKYRKATCKHIYAVRFWLALKQKLEKQKVEETEPVICKFCGSPYASPSPVSLSLRHASILHGFGRPSFSATSSLYFASAFSWLSSCYPSEARSSLSLLLAMVLLGSSPSALALMVNWLSIRISEELAKHFGIADEERKKKIGVCEAADR